MSHFQEAKAKFESYGIDVEAALTKLSEIPISDKLLARRRHCRF